MVADKRILIIILVMIICGHLRVVEAERKQKSCTGCGVLQTEIPDRCDSVGVQIQKLAPTIWMDGETFADGEWIDKSGNGSNLYTQNIELSHQRASMDAILLSSF
jgi:hypothetical protein